MTPRPPCPIPLNDYPHVLLGHGGGGRLMQQLLEKIFFAALDNPLLQVDVDAAILEIPREKIAFTTDSFVVQPYFFPGGDIGSLAVHGTTNDLAVMGAQPKYLSVSFILEEGLPMSDLWRIALSMGEAARSLGVNIVTGDTKVVQRGKGDGIFINTTGIGFFTAPEHPQPKAICEGDILLLNGDLGRHGMAVMAAREGLEFEYPLQSDSAALSPLIQSLLEAQIPLHAMRDLTRGGLASALIEMAETSGRSFLVHESGLPVHEAVKGACEILGLDPLYVANEGRLVIFVPPEKSEAALKVMRAHPLGKGAVPIGQVTGVPQGQVLLKTLIGVERPLDRLSGEQLPRIC